MSKKWNKNITLYVIFPPINSDSKLEKLQGVLQKIMLAPLLFLNVLVPETKKKI